MATALAETVNGTLRQVGAKLREARLRRQLTLTQVGRAVGLSPSMLSMVERGLAVPSIGTLVAVSDILKIPMGGLFDTPQAVSKRSMPLVRQSAQPVIAATGGVRRRLIVRDAINDIELAENTYPPRTASAERPLRHLGREFGVVLRGRLRVEVGGRVYTLRPGDAILFDSSVPHRFLNVGRGVVRTLWVNVHGTRWRGREADQRRHQRHREAR